MKSFLIIGLASFIVGSVALAQTENVSGTNTTLIAKPTEPRTLKASFGFR